MLSALLLVATLSAADSAPAADGAHVKDSGDIDLRNRCSHSALQSPKKKKPRVVEGTAAGGGEGAVFGSSGLATLGEQLPQTHRV